MKSDEKCLACKHPAAWHDKTCPGCCAEGYCECRKSRAAVLAELRESTQS